MNIVTKIDRQVSIKTAMISVSDKTGLEMLIPQLYHAVRDLKILSTGGTYGRIREIISGIDTNGGSLVQVSDYTGQPETQGGLVKTLDFKIYLGLLTETYNEAHKADLKRTGAEDIDLVIVNLYPFSQTIAKKDVTFEIARANIDIGGPCMLRAAAKNFHRVVPMVDPDDYPRLIEEISRNVGSTSLEFRAEMMRKTFDHTAQYDKAIAAYMAQVSPKEIDACYGVHVNIYA